MYYILTYYYTDDYLERRTPFRQSHFEHIKPYIDSGELLLGGATAAPADKGILIWNVSTLGQVEEFAEKDPYVVNGIVNEYNIQEWTIVAGSLYPHIKD